jgi:hypothetical protein
MTRTLFCIIYFGWLWCCTFGYTPLQWSKIRYLLKHDDLDVCHKKKLRQKIYEDHRFKWALKQSWNFKRKYCHIKHIRDVDIHELNYYSIRGLHEACKNYNGWMSFYLYATPIVYYNLLRGMTETNHLTRLPHRHIVNRDFRNKYPTLYRKYMMPPTYASEYDVEMYDRRLLVGREQDACHIRECVSHLTPFEQRLYYYRYDIHSLKKARSLKHVGELMCMDFKSVSSRLKEIEKKIACHLTFDKI